MATPRTQTLLGVPLAACALLVVCAAATAYSQAAATGAQAQPQIVRQVEAEAEAYQAGIAQTPIEVRQTVRHFDSWGHLKSTRQSSYRYALASAKPERGKVQRSALETGSDGTGGADLSDGATLPLVFLPGSIIHLSIRAETPAKGPGTIHFKSTPCTPPDVRRHWMGANIVSQCVEGDGYVDPASGALTHIRMWMVGLPLVFRTLTFPLGIDVMQLSNDTSFRLLKTDPSAPPRLVPEKAEYVTFTSRGRTVVDQTFEPAPTGALAPAPR